MDAACVREQYEWANVWWNNADDGTLPRVLLIGDSIAVGYGQAVIEVLAGTANVDRLGTSRSILDPVLLKETRLMLEDCAYAVIHFNNGLHGFHLTCEDYERGLRAYVELLRELAPAARLVWATSTPITMVDAPEALDEAKNAVVVRRNEVAAEIMAAFGIPAHDLHGLVVDRPDLKTGDGYHFNDGGRQVQGEAVAMALRACLLRG